MSQERVEALLRSYHAINRGDVEAAASVLPPDFEFIPPGILPDVEVYRGPEGFVRFWKTWQGTFENFHLEIEETIDAGDKVVVMVAASGVVKDSGAEVRTPSFPHVWAFEGDRIVRMEALQNRALALEAVGLSE